MSILIPGVEMPKYKHHLTITVWPDGNATCLLFNRDDNIRTIETVKAVPVPPHGRLIDADAAVKSGWTISRTYSASPTEMVCEVKTVDFLPTIIPADPPKEEEA